MKRPKEDKTIDTLIKMNDTMIKKFRLIAPILKKRKIKCGRCSAVHKQYKDDEIDKAFQKLCDSADTIDQVLTDLYSDSELIL